MFPSIQDLGLGLALRYRAIQNRVARLAELVRQPRDTSPAGDAQPSSSDSSFWDSWNESINSLTSAGDESQAQVEAGEGHWEDNSDPEWEERNKPKKPLSFSAPLPPEIEVKNLEIHDLKIGGYPFLSAFLHQRRYTDIHFGDAHRLLNYVMHLLEEAAFEFLKQYHPGRDKELGSVPFEGKERFSGDEVELQKWLEVIICLRSEKEVGIALGGDGIYDKWLHGELAELRHYATHSWVWTTEQLKPAVYFLAMVRDKGRLAILERILDITYRYHTESEDDNVTKAEKLIYDEALGDIPSEPKTVHQVLYRVQELLERACWDFWEINSPHRLEKLEWHCRDDRADRKRMPPGTEAIGWDCPERVELQLWHDTYGLDWDFPQFPRGVESLDPDVRTYCELRRLLRSACDLRNCTAHRSHTTDSRRTLWEMLYDAMLLADLLDNDKAAQEIESLRRMPLLDSVYIEQREDAVKSWEKRQQNYRDAEAAWIDWQLMNKNPDHRRIVKSRSHSFSDGPRDRSTSTCRRGSIQF